jgi:hypothetical protein
MSLGPAQTSDLSFPRPPPAVVRVRFVSEHRPGAKVIRKYEEPRAAYAVEEAEAQWSADELTGTASEPDDRLITVWLSADSPEEAPSPPVDDRRPVVVSVVKGGESIRWRPGLAVARCDPDGREAVAGAILDFSFLERELRWLEAFVSEAERRAQEDLPLAHRLPGQERSKGEPMARMFERVTAARLTFARLEPQLAPGARNLGAVGRRWFSRLARSLRIGARLEATSDRLEALEDFYEGANQRRAEYRWYREGHRLEKWIIAILVFESALMIVEIILHLRR